MTKVFKPLSKGKLFKPVQHAALVPVVKPIVQVIKQDRKIPSSIQGIPIGSENEAFVSMALDYLGWRYRYQYQIWGGRNLRGGQVLDFLVFTPGPWTIVDVLGRYWHTGSKEDNLSVIKVANAKGWRYLPMWDDKECKDYESSLIFLRHNLGG